MEKINVNMDAVEQEAQQSFTIARNLEPRYLSEMDTESTIQGVKNSIDAFNTSQELIGLLGEAVEAEAKTIKGLGLRFTELDELQADLIYKGVSIGQSNN